MRSTSWSDGSPAGTAKRWRAPSPALRASAAALAAFATAVLPLYTACRAPRGRAARTEKTRPRRTRERILETSLDLFNRFGEPNITTADIADEMNISPGNLYYHFRNKDEIIGDLYAAFEARVLPLLITPEGRTANVEDLWLLLHLLQEEMWGARFLYRDLDELASRNRRVGARFGDLLRRGVGTVVELARGMVSAGRMRASEREIAALAQNVVLVATYWQSFRRMGKVTRAKDDEVDFGRGAYQVLSLIAPYLVGSDRKLLDRLGADYL